MSTYLADSDFELLLIERTDGVAFVTVNAPPMNVMTPPLFRELAKFGAQVAEDEVLKSFFREGLDVHRATAAQVFDIDPDDDAGATAF